MLKTYSLKQSPSLKIEEWTTDTHRTIWQEPQDCEFPIEDYQVAACMVLVKLARSMEGSKVDNYIDMLGYAAISGMLRTEENELYV
jgi:hypothetical protein